MVKIKTHTHTLAFCHSLDVDCLSLFDIWYLIWDRAPRVAFNLFNAVKSFYSLFLSRFWNIIFLVFCDLPHFFRRIDSGLRLFCRIKWKRSFCLVVFLWRKWTRKKYYLSEKRSRMNLLWFLTLCWTNVRKTRQKESAMAFSPLLEISFD